MAQLIEKVGDPEFKPGISEKNPFKQYFQYLM
jgi:hypothetical protein